VSGALSTWPFVCFFGRRVQPGGSVFDWLGARRGLDLCWCGVAQTPLHQHSELVAAKGSDSGVQCYGSLLAAPPW
jgi:hypothetical protein